MFVIVTRFIALLVLLAASASAYSSIVQSSIVQSSTVQSSTVQWDGRSPQLELTNHVAFAAEPQQGWSVEEARGLPAAAWTRVRGENVSLGYSDTAYWFRLDIDNIAGSQTTALLEIAYPVLDHIEVYSFVGGNPVSRLVMGDKYPFRERPVYHRNFVIPLDLPPDQLVTVLLRVRSTSSMQVPMTLWSPDTFHAEEQARSLFEGLYYGIVLVMVLYNLFVYLAVGERSFLYYIGYITAMPLFLASLHGVAFQYLWPDATWWNDQAIIVFLNLVVVFGGIFSMRFISVLPSTHPVLSRVTILVVSVAGLLALAGLLVPYRYMILPTIGLAFIGCTGMLLLSIVRWMKGDPAARYYGVAWVFMLFGGIVLALSKFTVLPRNLVTENATQVGSAIGVILLSLALADRLNREKKRNFEAQRQLLVEERKVRLAQEKSLQIQQDANTLLEQRVEERTRDLATLNERLRELNATDALTGLKNRGYFDRAFQTLSVGAFRFGQPLSLLIIDIDRFKQFNDTYGHLVGDDCLRMVAQGIRQYVTRPQDLAARYGGEEFVVILPDTPEEGAVQVAEKIRREIEGTDFRVSDTTVRLTISIGVCSLTPDQADATRELFRRADEALYAAKAQGRNRVVCHDPDQEALTAGS